MSGFAFFPMLYLYQETLASYASHQKQLPTLSTLFIDYKDSVTTKCPLELQNLSLLPIFLFV